MKNVLEKQTDNNNKQNTHVVMIRSVEDWDL